MHVAAVVGRGRPRTNTSNDDLKIKGTPRKDTGGCNSEVVSKDKGNPKEQG